jgi:hypothetical protein
MNNIQPVTLSPDFATARVLSQTLRVFFIVNFAVAVVGLLATAIMPLWPQAVQFSLDDSLAAAVRLPMEQRVSTAVESVLQTLPALFVLYYAIRLFGLFAKGEVFTTRAIGHIRAVGQWTIVWAVAPAILQMLLHRDGHMHFEAVLLAFGVSTFIAAHVMAEAQRIADENASIL